MSGRENNGEAAEREAAKQRILAQAEAERVPVDDTTRAVPDRRWRRELPCVKPPQVDLV